MPKAVKKVVTALPPVKAGNPDLHLVWALTLVVFAVLFIALIRKSGQHSRYGRWRSPGFRKEKFLRFGRCTKPASKKQLSYIANLVAEQNEFRGKQISTEAWLRDRAGPGFVSKKLASELIKALLEENQELREEFEIKKRNPSVGKFRGEISVSDLRSFYYCERSAYFSVLQYPSQNQVELNKGSLVHQAYSNEEGRDSSKPSRVTEHILGCEPLAERVEWFSNTAKVNLRHATLPLTGRPDGFVHFQDGSRSVIELKSVASMPSSPYPSDFVQTEAYSLIASNFGNIRDETFVLYMDRFTRELALHARKRVLTEYDLARLVTKIGEGVRDPESLKPTTSAAKCNGCGYRSICPSKVSG